MKRIPDFAVTAARNGNDKLIVHIAHINNKSVVDDLVLEVGPNAGETFGDEHFEDAKKVISEIIVEKAMDTTGTTFNELDIVVAFHAPEFDNIALDLVPLEES